MEDMDLLTARDVCEYLNISKSTLEKMQREDLLQPTSRGRYGTRYFHRRDVLAYLEQSRNFRPGS